MFSAVDPRAFIFDLDGTVLDSEPVYWESDRAFLASWGVDYDEELNASMVGRGAIEFFRSLEGLFPSSPLNALPLSERVRLKDEAYLLYAAPRLRAFPAMASFIHALALERMPMAIASGSSPAVIDATLRSAGLLDAFPIRVSASEVARGKPEPDVFLEAARRLGVPPGACVVFEDSRPGVLAAKAAGMACVALPAPGSEDAPEFHRADFMIPGGAGAFDPSDALDWLASLRREAPSLGTRA